MLPIAAAGVWLATTWGKSAGIDKLARAGLCVELAGELGARKAGARRPRPKATVVRLPKTTWLGPQIARGADKKAAQSYLI